MLLKVIKPHYFIVAFAIGMFYVYITAPRPEIVEKFPSPYNAGSIKYKNNNSCYIFSSNKTECPINESLIKRQPL